MNSETVSSYTPSVGFPYPSPFSTIHAMTSVNGVDQNATAAPQAAPNARSRKRPAPPAEQRQKRKQPVVCEFCHRTMRTDNLRRHLLTCKANPKKSKGVQCPQCSKVFSRGDSLRRHTKSVCPGSRERASTIPSAFRESQEAATLVSATKPSPIFTIPCADQQPIASSSTLTSNVPAHIAAPAPSYMPNPFVFDESQVPLIPETCDVGVYDSDYTWANTPQDILYPSSYTTTSDSSTEGYGVDVPRSTYMSDPRFLPGYIQAYNQLAAWAAQAQPSSGSPATPQTSSVGYPP